MTPIETIIHDTLQVLRDPAWQGIGVIVSTSIALIMLCKSGQNPPSARPRPLLKKI